MGKELFSVIGVTSEEPLTIVSAMMNSCREGSPRRPGIIVYDPEAARAKLLQDGGVVEAEAGEDINNSPPMRLNLLDQQPRTPRTMEGRPEHTVPYEAVHQPDP